jgi:CTP:molybdopterin cytidylyltransferase MocA
MTDIALVMPMAGRGSRFRRSGAARPKPLIELEGRCFFEWALDSVRGAAPVREAVFVVLAEDVAAFAIDAEIRKACPAAHILVLDEPTAGAAETAALGVAALESPGVIVINDCDHAFVASRLSDLAAALSDGAAGALLGFASADPAYSYARLAADGEHVLDTVEKRCVGPYALAGCYLFRDRAAFQSAYDGYAADCPYPELFISGLYNRLTGRGETVLFAPLDAHVSFGTPEEIDRIQPGALAALLAGARGA